MTSPSAAAAPAVPVPILAAIITRSGEAMSGGITLVTVEEAGAVTASLWLLVPHFPEWALCPGEPMLILSCFATKV